MVNQSEYAQKRLKRPAKSCKAEHHIIIFGLSVAVKVYGGFIRFPANGSQYKEKK